MQYVRKMRHLLKGVFGMCVFLCSIASIAGASLSGEAPHLNIGDKWQFKKHELKGDKLSTQSQVVTEKTDDGLFWIFIENFTNGNKNWWLFDDFKNAAVKQYYFNSSSANLRGRLRTEKQDPVRIQFPLAIGKKYSLVEHWTNEIGEGVSQYAVQVTGIERIETEAGTFDAWKLQIDGKWSLTNDSSQKGITKGQIWYSPEVKRIVKQIFNGYQDGRLNNQITFELQKWTPGSVK
jgi:hypothetical protein